MARGFRSGKGADALISVGIALLGGFLLLCSARMLPGAYAAGGTLLSPALVAPDPSSPVLMLLAGFGAAAAGVALTLWWAAGAVFALAGCLLHRTGFHSAGARVLSLAPGPLRRLSAALLGLSLAAGTVPAHAADGTEPARVQASPVALPNTSTDAPRILGSHTLDPRIQGHKDPSHAAATVVRAPAGNAPAEDEGEISPLWRPLPQQPSGSNLVTGTPRPDPGHVVVSAGDTLWSLAGEQLGPLAGDAEIAALWPRWYEANRDTIGPDPGLIRPGQVLTVPPL